ncbi:MAG: hypothetical protein EBU62_08755 [Proteobacteria bacterium]|nr:hypothetical protein [Pseudomonadota bacterium]
MNRTGILLEHRDRDGNPDRHTARIIRTIIPIAISSRVFTDARRCGSNALGHNQGRSDTQSEEARNRPPTVSRHRDCFRRTYSTLNGAFRVCRQKNFTRPCRIKLPLFKRDSDTIHERFDAFD